MTKSELRKEAKSRRDANYAAMSSAGRYAAAVLLAGAFDERLPPVSVVAAYLPIGSEIDPLPLIDRLLKRGLTIVLPHVTGRRSALRFLRWTPGDPLIEGPMGLHQPDRTAPEIDPEIIFAPLLAFDARGHRLGYGAGHYDRAFARLPAARRIGLAWQCQQIEVMPDEAWDVPLHGVVTEAGWTVG